MDRYTYPRTMTTKVWRRTGYKLSKLSSSLVRIDDSLAMTSWCEKFVIILLGYSSTGSGNLGSVFLFLWMRRRGDGWLQPQVIQFATASSDAQSHSGNNLARERESGSRSRYSLNDQKTCSWRRLDFSCQSWITPYTCIIKQSLLQVIMQLETQQE